DAYPAIQSSFSGVITTLATPAFQARVSGGAHRPSAARAVKQTAVQRAEQRWRFIESPGERGVRFAVFNPASCEACRSSGTQAAGSRSDGRWTGRLVRDLSWRMPSGRG